MPSDKVLRKLYSGDYEFNVDKTSLARFKAISKKVIDRLKHLNPEGSTLVDVGAGYGTFVDVATSIGLDAIGIEPSRNLYKFANKKLKNRIFHTDLHNFVKTDTKQYDFISLIHVIEHVNDPKNFLRIVFKLLKAGGVLYIETPNSDGFLANIEKENYTFLTPPDHINLFSTKSLRIVIDQVDSEATIYLYTYSYPEHLVGILRTMKNKILNYHLSKGGNVHRPADPIKSKLEKEKIPFFDRVVAPFLTPLLNIGNRGSFLQAFIQKKN